MESTHFSFKLHYTSKVSLKILDQYGRVVASLINNELMNPGKYVEHFDASQYKLSPGVYYFSLLSDQKSVQRKMLYMR